MGALDYLNGLAAELLSEPDDLATAETLSASAAFSGVAGMEAILGLARLIGEAADTDLAVSTVDRLLPADADVTTACCRLIVSCFVLIRSDFTVRQDAAAARARLSAITDSVYPRVDTAELLDWLVRLTGTTAMHLSAVAATREPLVRIETKLSLPSTLAAFDLYGDANRAGEIVVRNRMATPMIMPAIFEARAR